MMYVRSARWLHVGDERLVRLPHPLPVDAVHVGVVEEVSHLPPALVEDLPPFRLAVQFDLHAGQVERFGDVRRAPRASR